MTLDILKTNSSATIKKLNLPSDRKRRLQDMGVTEGTTVKHIQSNFLKSLYAYDVRGTVIALRYEDVCNIEI